MVYDSVNNILTEFAGGKGATTATNAVWSLSHADGLGGTPVWTNLIANGGAGSPPKREGHIAVYDATNNRMMIFGGTTATGFPDLNDAWVLVNANGIGGKPQWSKVKAAGTKPIGRDGHVGVYDSADNRLIIYGGGSMDAESFATWTLTGTNGLP